MSNFDMSALNTAFAVQNPRAIAIDGKDIAFSEEREVTARIERMDFDTLCNLWNAALPLDLTKVAQSPWLAAIFWRLCRADAVLFAKGTLSHANRGQQGVAAEDTIPAEVRDHPA